METKTPKGPKVKTKDDLVKMGAKAVADFDKSKDSGLEQKLKGQVAPEFDAEIGDVVKQRAKFTTAFQKGLSTYLNANTDETGIVNKPGAEFGDGLAKTLYNAFGSAMGMSEDSIKGLAESAKFGKSASTDARAYKLLFKSMTGLNVSGLQEELTEMDQIDYAGILQSVMKPLGEASTKFLVGESTDKLVSGADSEEVSGKIKKLCDIVGMKLKPKDLLTPQQRLGVYQNALVHAIGNYGAEYLPTYGAAKPKTE